jgi:hypothetical protein
MRRTLTLKKEYLALLCDDELSEVGGGTINPQKLEIPTKAGACLNTLFDWSCNQLCVTPTIRC